MNERGTPTRRRFLQTLAAGGAVALAGCPGGDGGSGTPTPSESTVGTPDGTSTSQIERRSRYNTVVDITDEGGDATGEEPITSTLEDVVADDTLVVFPSGTYRIGRLTFSEYENFGFRAASSEPVRLVPSGPSGRLGTTLLKFVDIGQFEFQGFTFDFREPGYGGMFYLLSHDDFLIRDVTVNGQYPPDVSGFRFEVVDNESRGIVERLVARDGAAGHTGSVGIWVGYSHAGELYFKDCEIANFPDNGLYASAPGYQGPEPAGNGPVHVRGGIYKNNNVSNVRLGSTGSSARNVRVVIDEVPPHKDVVNARGIRLRQRDDHLIENCEVVVTADAGVGFGGLVVHSDAGGATIKNSRIRVNKDGVHAVNVLRPEDLREGPTFENVTIEGSAAGGEAVAIRNRTGVEFNKCEIVQDGNSRNGILFDTVNDSTLADSRIDVTGQPIINVDSNVTRRNMKIETDGSVKADL